MCDNTKFYDPNDPDNLSGTKEANATNEYDKLIQCSGSIMEALDEVLQNNDKRTRIGEQIKKIELSKGKLTLSEVKLAKMIVGWVTDELFLTAQTMLDGNDL